jgi:ATP-dependent Clp protease ATP-binding subunit ClpA
MFEHFDAAARDVLMRAGHWKAETGWHQVERGHLFLGLADVDTPAAAVILACQKPGEDFADLKQRVVSIPYAVKLSDRAGTPWASYQVSLSLHSFSPDAQAVLEEADAQRVAGGDRFVTPLHILLALVWLMEKAMEANAPDMDLIPAGLTRAVVSRRMHQERRVALDIEGERASAIRRVPRPQEPEKETDNGGPEDGDEVVVLRREADRLAGTVLGESSFARPTGPLAVVLEALRLEVRAASIQDERRWLEIRNAQR